MRAADCGFIRAVHMSDAMGETTVREMTDSIPEGAAEDAQGSLATIAGDADVGTCDDEDEPETEDEKSEDDDLCSSDDG